MDKSDNFEITSFFKRFGAMSNINSQINFQSQEQSFQISNSQLTIFELGFNISYSGEMSVPPLDWSVPYANNWQSTLILDCTEINFLRKDFSGLEETPEHLIMSPFIAYPVNLQLRNRAFIFILALIANVSTPASNYFIELHFWFKFLRG